MVWSQLEFQFSLLFLEQVKKVLGKFGILMAFRMKCGDSGNVFQHLEISTGTGKVCVFWD